MLVLSRCPNEGVEILGDGLRIEVEVIRVRGKRTRISIVALSIVAPKAVTIIRGELVPFFTPTPNKGGRLVLGRSTEETVVFLLPGGAVGELRVVGISGRRVRFGFTFPEIYRIRRKELSASTP